MSGGRACVLTSNKVFSMMAASTLRFVFKYGAVYKKGVVYSFAQRLAK